MKPEVLKVKRELERITPQEKKWAKLIEKNGIHPREEVIERWVKFPELFDQEEQDSMEKHFNVCEKCQKTRDNTFPLLRKAS